MISGIQKNSTVKGHVRKAAKAWSQLVLLIVGVAVTGLLSIILGLNTIPSSIPIVDAIRMHPGGSIILGIAFVAISIFSYIISRLPSNEDEQPGINVPKDQLQRRANRLLIVSTTISTVSFVAFASLLATIFIRPSWCPSSLCSPVRYIPITNQKSVYDSNLEVYLVTVQSSAFVLQSEPSSYTVDNLPTQAGAFRTDNQLFHYKIVFGVHNLSQSQYSLLITNVQMVVRNIRITPYPLNVWNNPSSLTYENNLYSLGYDGQPTRSIIEGRYLVSPFGKPQLISGETDTITLQLKSSELTDMEFGIQIVYRFSNSSTLHTIMVPNNFEVISSNASNWNTYSLNNGQLVKNGS